MPFSGLCRHKYPYMKTKHPYTLKIKLKIKTPLSMWVSSLSGSPWNLADSQRASSPKVTQTGLLRSRDSPSGQAASKLSTESQGSSFWRLSQCWSGLLVTQLPLIPPCPQVDFSGSFTLFCHSFLSGVSRHLFTSPQRVSHNNNTHIYYRKLQKHRQAQGERS